MDNLAPSQSPQSCFPGGQFQPVLVSEVIPPIVLDFALEIQTIPLFPSLQLVKILLDGSTALWDTDHSSQLYAVNELAGKASVSSSKSLIITLINTVLSIEPSGALLETGLQLDHLPLIMTV